MANNNMEKTKEDAGCRWVRAHLSLWVGDRNLRADGNGEGGDLSTLEYLKIEQHLNHCMRCCRHRSELERALKMLAAAAADLPTGQETPSLWPALKRQIEDLHQPAAVRWIRVAQVLTDQWGCLLSGFKANSPVRRACAPGKFPSSLTSQENERLGSKPRMGLVLGLGLVASLLIAAIAVTGLWRESANAHATIQAEASPLLEEQASPVAHATERGTEAIRSDDNPTEDEMAQADVARTPEPPGGGMNSTGDAKSAAPPRFGYDLEHGIPMPPDARESKPVY